MGARQVSLLLTKINLSNLFILFLPKTDDLVARRLHQAGSMMAWPILGVSKASE